MSFDSKKAEQMIIARYLKVCKEVAQEVEQNMKSDAPVDTGYLRDHITHTVTQVSDSIIMEFKSDAPYSIFQDKGTSKMNAHPFFEKNLIGLKKKIQERGV
jgi:HK97 gp10 family phage protein